MNFAHKFGVGPDENLLLKIFLPALKNLAGKTSNLLQIIEDCCQSEARNFEMVQHIDKQITCFIYNNCATRWYQTWGHHPTAF